MIFFIQLSRLPSPLKASIFWNTFNMPSCRISSASSLESQYLIQIPNNLLEYFSYRLRWADRSPCLHPSINCSSACIIIHNITRCKFTKKGCMTGEFFSKKRIKCRIIHLKFLNEEEYSKNIVSFIIYYGT